MKRYAPLLCSWLLIVTPGCTPDFDKEWQVKDLRILALRADPAEVLDLSLDASGRLSLPDTIPPVTVTALVVDPTAPADAQVQWELWLCSAEDVRCDEAEVQLLHTPRRSSPIDQISVEVILPSELFPDLLQADPLRGFGGLPVMVELRVWREAYSARGVKRLVYGARLPPEKQPNQNPSIVDVTVEQSPEDLEAYKLLPLNGPQDKEQYWVATFTGGKRTFDEYLEFAFYTSAGELSHGETGGKPSLFVVDKKVDDVSSDWTPADPAWPTDIWIVVRDDRGGVGWISLESGDGQGPPSAVSNNDQILDAP